MELRIPTTTIQLRRLWNYWNLYRSYPFLKAKQNNYHAASKMTKLPKFRLSIHIFESQTEQQLLRDFEDDEITEIRTVHTHFWKPNRTTTTTRLWRRQNYRNSNCPYTFLKAKQNNNYYETLKMTKLPKFAYDFKYNSCTKMLFGLC